MRYGLDQEDYVKGGQKEGNMIGITARPARQGALVKFEVVV